MRILVSGNPGQGLAQAISQVLPEHEITFMSRATGHDLTKSEVQQHFAEVSVDYDVIIINSALWKFNQTILLETVFKKLKSANKRSLIICVGSTTDRVKKGTDWLYNAEKKALRDFANSLGIAGVWSNAPRVTLISFGTLSNNQDKHPDRKTMPLQQAAGYIKWLLEQPAGVHVNELSVDPLQTDLS